MPRQYAGWLGPLYLESVACRFLCRLHGETQKQRSIHRVNPKKKARREGGGGGAWRAFIHVKCKGQQLAANGMQELAAEYRQLPPCQKERFKKIGEAAAFTHRHGYALFGVASAPLQPYQVRVGFDSILGFNFDSNDSKLLCICAFGVHTKY